MFPPLFPPITCIIIKQTLQPHAPKTNQCRALPLHFQPSHFIIAATIHPNCQSHTFPLYNTSTCIFNQQTLQPQHSNTLNAVGYHAIPAIPAFQPSHIHMHSLIIIHQTCSHISTYSKLSCSLSFTYK